MKLVQMLSVAFFGALVAAGCSSTTSDAGDAGAVIDTGKGDTTPAPDTAGETATVGCGTCAASKCNDKVTACAADTQCQKDIDCINGCSGGKACDNTCISNECGAGGATSCPPTDTLFNDLIVCLQANCSDPCFGKP